MPVRLERALNARSHPARFTVVNLGYNNEGAYSLKFTLRDYAYLAYDVVILYENYNDLVTPPEAPNLAAYRRDSPVFRLTGYLPIFPLVLKETGASPLRGGDARALSRPGQRAVFKPTVTQRAAAGVLNTTADIGQSVERQLDRMMAEPQRQVVATGSTGCAFPWARYCQSMLDAVDYAERAGRLVLIVGLPYMPGSRLRPRHASQQHELAGDTARRYGSNRRVRYVNLGSAVELADPQLSFDEMHLTPEGNARIAAALAPVVLASTSGVQLPVESFHLIEQTLDRVARLDAGAAGSADRAPAVGIVEQRDDGVGERARIARRCEQAEGAAGDDGADAADVGARARHGGGEALDQRDRRPFVARRQQEDIDGAVDLREIAAPAEKPRAVENARRAREPFELGAQLAVSDDQKHRLPP